MLRPFEGPRAKIGRAQVHANNLSTLIAEYGLNAKVTFGPLVPPGRQRLVYLDPPPPLEVALVFGDCVHNLRSALDIAIIDIARLKNKSADRIKFPFAESEEKLIEILDKDIRRLGQDVSDVILKLKPYKGENILIRLLHDLDVDDKHKLLSPVFAAAAVVMDGCRIMADSFLQEIGKQEFSYVSFEGGALLCYLEDENTVFATEFVGPKPHTVYLAHHQPAVVSPKGDPLSYYLEYEGTVRPYLPEDHTRAPSEPISELALDLIRSTSEIVDLLAGKFG